MPRCNPRKSFNTNLNYNWLLFYLCIPDSVDLRTKRKAFDLVMAVRRLEEEKRILVAEMHKHWKCLCTRADTLKLMSSQHANMTSGMYLSYLSYTWHTLQYIGKFLINKKLNLFLRVRWDVGPASRWDPRSAELDVEELASKQQHGKACKELLCSSSDWKRDQLWQWFSGRYL